MFWWIWRVLLQIWRVLLQTGGFKMIPDLPFQLAVGACFDGFGACFYKFGTYFYKREIQKGPQSICPTRSWRMFWWI